MREAELLDPVPNLVAIQAKQCPGTGLVAGAAPKRLNQQTSLQPLEVDSPGGQLELVAGADCRSEGREIMGIQPIAVREQHGPFDDVAKFPHVARPSIALQQRVRGRCRAEDALPELGIERIDEVLDQERNVLGVCPERRQ